MENSSSLVTLAILTHNNEEDIAELLESVLAQEDKLFSLIILENGSSDDTRREIEKFLPRLEASFPNFELIKSTNNLGEGIGLMNLAVHCKSEFISIIHGDDLLRNNYSRLMNLIVKSGKGFDIVSPTLQEIDEKGNLGRVLRPAWSRLNWINKFMTAFGNPGLMPGVMISKSALLEANSHKSLSPNLLFNADSVIWHRVSCSNPKIILVREVTYLYRRNFRQSSVGSKNDTMLALARTIKLQSSHSLIKRFLVRSGTAFDLDFIENKSEYQSQLLSLGFKFLPSYVGSFMKFFYMIFQKFAPKAKTISNNLD